METSGSGQANDAEVQSISSEDVATVDAEALTEGDASYAEALAKKAEEVRAKAIAEADRRLASAQAKVDRLTEHLEAARAALAEAQAEREGI